MTCGSSCVICSRLGAFVFLLPLLMLLMCMAVPVASHASEACHGQQRTVRVTSGVAGMLYSPNYPGLYPNGENCSWLLTSGEVGKVVEAEVREMDLEMDKAGNCVDLLAAYDGDSAESPLLTDWCGQQRTVIRSTGQSLYLSFLTSQLTRRSGFVLKYRVTSPYSSQCVEGGVRTLTVGDSPVLLQIAQLNHTSECQWRLQGTGAVRLVLDMVRISGVLPCHDANLTINDGGDSGSSMEVDRWCGGSKVPPFSSFYTSGREALLTTSLLPSDRRQFPDVSLELWVRVHAMPLEEECDTNSPSVLEFQGAPLYFPVPFSSWTSGEECTIRVQSQTPNEGGFRVDILTTGDRKASCDDIEEPALWISDGKRVEAECWRERHPVHWTHTQSISVLPRHNTTSFLRLQATDFPCTGYVIDRLYTGSHTLTQTIPDIGYPRNVQCQFLIDGEKGDHPVVELTTNFLAEDGCGDMVTVYNGSSRDGEVLLKHCAGGGEDLRGRKVVSPGTKLLLLFATDDDDTYGTGLQVRYYSVPETEICADGRRELYATSETQTLQSPNFPHYYHLNYDCFFVIRTNNTGEVIHIKLTSTGFQRTDDFLQFFDHFTGEDRMGTVSGDERLREFTSTKQSLTVRFHSDETHSDGGWRLEYRSVKRGDLSEEEEQKKDMTFNTLTMIIAGSLGVLILILVVVTTVTCCRVKNVLPPPVRL